ncbi:MAG: hypothetical protein WC895_04770 [Candidatus Shapirobacteria bacterium]|jgi:hypothetical protein
MEDTKRDARVTKAIEFIKSLKDANPDELNALIEGTMGKELADFMTRYAQLLIAQEPERILENAAALMVMGYLLRVDQEGSKIVSREDLN